MFDPRSAITRLSLALLLGSPIQASAEDSGLPDTGIKLGPVQSFGNEGAARAACKPDGVVWADRSTGFYYPRFAPEYGSTPTGVFTCYKQAAKADYWSFVRRRRVDTESRQDLPVHTSHLQLHARSEGALALLGTGSLRTGQVLVELDLNEQALGFLRRAAVVRPFRSRLEHSKASECSVRGRHLPARGEVAECWPLHPPPTRRYELTEAAA